MKKILIIFFLLILSINVFPQSRQRVGLISKFGIAGGFTPIWVTPNFDPINTKLKSFGTSKLPEEGMLATGGSGYAYVMFINNLRIGGMGYSGTVSRDAVVNGYKREMIYSMGGGGVTIEYTLPTIKGLGLSFGAILGAGSFDIKLHQNQGDVGWDEIWNKISSGDDPNNINTKLTNSYYMFIPTVNLDVPITRFLALRIGGGYQFTFAGDWEIDNGRDLNGVPSDLNGDSFFIQSGIFLGFFAF
jgi:hypothetical protein